MSPATAFIPTFAAITLLLGGFNELSVQLTLVGILGIILHTAITPTDLSGPYPNFDNYPTQPPLRDYVLVFGLASLALGALFSRVRPLFSTRGQSALKSRDAMTDLHPHPTTHPLSPSHTSSGQWTTGSTLVVESPPSITSQATGHHEAADPAEPVTLKLRVSQLEVALEEIRCRLDALSTEKQDTDTASRIPTTVIAKPSPTHLPTPPLNLDTTLISPTQLPSPTPSPIDPNPNPLAALKPVDATVNAREHLRSFAEFVMEGTRQTDQLIHRIRNILAEANMANDAAPEGYQGEDNATPLLSMSRSMQIPSEHLPPSSTTTTFAPSPPPSPSPSSSARLDQPLQTSTTRRVRVTSPLPSAVNRTSETAKGSARSPKFSLTPEFSDISQAPCSTPLRSAEVGRSISPSPPPLLRALEADFGRRDIFSAPTFKRAKEADTRVHPVSRATSIPTKIPPQDSPPRYKRDLISRVRERSLKALYSPLPRAGVESSLDRGKNVKGKGKTVRALEGMSDWLAERRRRRNAPTEPCPLHRNCQG